MNKESVEIISVNQPAHVVNKNNWHTIVDEFRVRMDAPNYPAMKILESYNLCPVPLFNELSIETWNLRQAIGGIGVMRNPIDYYNAQMLYVDGVNIIDRAVSDIQPYLKDAS